jgi:hypothetical protein
VTKRDETKYYRTSTTASCMHIKRSQTYLITYHVRCARPQMFDYTQGSDATILYRATSNNGRLNSHSVQSMDTNPRSFRERL